MSLKRVSKKEPCPQCGHDSWCALTEDAILCMRDSSGRPCTLKSGEVGYWFDLDGRQRKQLEPRFKTPEPPAIDAEAMLKKWRSNTKAVDFNRLSVELGIKCSALLEMGVAWANEHSAFAFPMRDGNGRVCGIRLRASNGFKWSVKGSKTGLFLPWCPPQKTAYLPEGPTDTAALLSIGCYAIGRPSNSGGMDIIKQTVRRLGIQQAVIIADNDEDKFTPAGSKFNPGYDGAKSLARNLTIPCCIMTLPCKDARAFVKEGGTVQMLESIVNTMTWENTTASDPHTSSRNL